MDLKNVTENLKVDVDFVWHSLKIIEEKLVFLNTFMIDKTSRI